jgi:hypothetical protein
MRKVLSIVFYVIAGFFVYMVCEMAFTNLGTLPSKSEPPLWVKPAIVGGFSIPGAIALVIGLAISRFQNWKRDIGIVFVSGVGVTVFGVLMIVCILQEPEFTKMLSNNNSFAMFSDFVSGVSCILLFLVAGIVLIMSSRKEEPAPPIISEAQEKQSPE